MYHAVCRSSFASPFTGACMAPSRPVKAPFWSQRTSSSLLCSSWLALRPPIWSANIWKMLFRLRWSSYLEFSSRTSANISSYSQQLQVLVKDPRLRTNDTSIALETFSDSGRLYKLTSYLFTYLLTYSLTHSLTHSLYKSTNQQ